MITHGEHSKLIQHYRGVCEIGDRRRNQRALTKLVKWHRTGMRLETRHRVSVWERAIRFTFYSLGIPTHYSTVHTVTAARIAHSPG
eukprot:COSAG02_NODE_41999_length_388_cov_35857.688581_1_plen_85_part_10